MSLIIHESNDKNLMTPANMDIMYEIFSEVINDVSVKYNGETYTFEDLCVRPYPSYDACTSQESGIFSWFEFNSTAWSTQDDIQSRLDIFSSFIDVSVCVICLLNVVFVSRLSQTNT